MDININPITLEVLDEILVLEDVSFPVAWTKKDFIKINNDKKNISLVAELDKKIVGYVVFECVGLRCTLLSIAVSPNMRRKKIGSTLIREVLCNILELFDKITLTSSEKNLDAHLFFKNLGFKAVKISNDFYGKNHDGYCFEYYPKEAFVHNKNLVELCKGK